MPRDVVWLFNLQLCVYVYVISIVSKRGFAPPTQTCISIRSCKKNVPTRSTHTLAFVCILPRAVGRLFNKTLGSPHEALVTEGRGKTFGPWWVIVSLRPPPPGGEVCDSRKYILGSQFFYRLAIFHIMRFVRSLPPWESQTSAFF